MKYKTCPKCGALHLPRECSGGGTVRTVDLANPMPDRETSTTTTSKNSTGRDWLIKDGKIVDWRERFYEKFKKNPDYGDLKSFIAEVEKLAREEGKRLGEDKAREKVRPVVFEIRSSLKAELVEKIEERKEKAQSFMAEYAYLAAIDIIKSA